MIYFEDFGVPTIISKPSHAISSVISQLEEDIKKHGLKAGDRLQPVRDLAARYGVSYVTMQKSVNLLNHKGLLEVKRGSGVFVKAQSGNNGSDERGFIFYLILAGYDCDMARFPVYAKMLYGIENEVANFGGKLVVVRVANETEVEKIDGDADGYLLFWNDEMPTLKERLHGKPCVWLMGIDKQWGDHITFNDFSVGKVVCEYFSDKKYSKVAYVGAGLGANHERKVGFEYYAKRRGLDITYMLDEKAIEKGKLGDRFNSTIIDRWLDCILDPAERYDAVFVEMDSMAVWVYNAMERRGVSVGKDIEIVGCNCEESLLSSLPKMPTTVDIHSEEIGAMGIEHILWRKRNLSADRRVIKIEPSIRVFQDDMK